MADYLGKRSETAAYVLMLFGLHVKDCKAGGAARSKATRSRAAETLSVGKSESKPGHKAPHDP